MPKLQVISREHHAHQRWQRYTHYRFTANDALAILTTQELPKAMLHLPIAFLASAGAFVPVAVLGMKPGKNLFVAADGRWVGAYIPAVYRGYPFVLAPTQEGKQVLCIDEDSGLLSATDGERFFTDDGQPSQPVSEVLNFLNQVAASRQTTERICALLQQHSLIQPWPIKVQGPDGEQALEGLFRIDEQALNQLPAEAFMALRDAGALVTIYSQLLSMQHLQTLGQLAAAHAQAEAKSDAKAAAPAPTQGKDLDLSFLEGSETLKFF